MVNILKGKIISMSSPKTAIVEVTRYFAHPMYKKRVRRTKRYKVHYENEKLNIGAVIEMIETKPISKNKHFKLKI